MLCNYLQGEDIVLRAQFKESGKPEDQLNFPIQKCKDIKEERDVSLLEAQIIAADRDALKRETNNLQAQQRAVALLKAQLNLIRVQCDEIAKERNSFKLRSRRSEADRKTISKVIEALKIGTEELRVQFNDYCLLEKQLDTIRQQCENVNKERNALILRAQLMAQSKESIKIERDALKLQIENFRAKINDADQLEMQLNVVTEDSDNIAKESDSLISEAQHMGTDTEATEEDLEVAALLEDQINV
jgi:chromosome segregation ATPase